MSIEKLFVKKVLSCLLVTMIIVSCVPLAVMPVAAQSSVPSTAKHVDQTFLKFDADKTEEVARAVLASEIMLYLGATNLDLDEEIDCLSLEELSEIASHYPRYPRQITDSMDRIVTIYKPVERIVVFNHDGFLTMRSINATDKIVGVCANLERHFGPLFPSELTDYPNIGVFFNPDYEAVLHLNPDIIILSGWTYRSGGCSENDAIQKKFEELSPRITVIRLDCDNPSYYVKEVRKIGYILEKEEEAEELIDFYEKYLNTIKERVDALSEDDKPKVYFELPRANYQTPGSGTAVHRIIVDTGGNNIFSDLSDIVDIDPEEVINRNPEIIVKGARAPGYNLDDPTILIKTRDEIMNRPELRDVVAVKNESVYIFPYGFIYSPTHFVCMIYMAKWFHPALFNDLDPEEIHQEYLTKFLEVDYDLDEHGVFVYPEVN